LSITFVREEFQPRFKRCTGFTREIRVVWQEVEDPDFEEHFRRIFEAIVEDECESRK
jgi:hypothetical protein